MDATLSAGQKEVAVWADHQRIMTAPTGITIADEIGSSTSPRYQSAFAAATIASRARLGHRVIMTTHHDGLLHYAERTSNIQAQGITIEQGKRTIATRPVISNPINFASNIGLPPRVVALAKLYYDRLINSTDRYKPSV